MKKETVYEKGDFVKIIKKGNQFFVGQIGFITDGYRSPDGTGLYHIKLIDEKNNDTYITKEQFEYVPNYTVKRIDVYQIFLSGELINEIVEEKRI